MVTASTPSEGLRQAGTGAARDTGPLPSAWSENAQVAAWLRQAAELLQAQGANPFRVGAYRRAADSIAGLDASVRQLFVEQGLEGLEAVPGIGAGLASAIAEMLRTGHWTLLERLRGSLDPVRLFQTVPGVGPGLAQRLHDVLGVDTLEALEAACHDRRIAAVPGVGERRAQALRAALAAILARPRPAYARAATPIAPAPGSAPAVAGVSVASPPTVPTVETLLDVDREYRTAASAGTLPTIAPRRFNPDGRPWLPILHTTRRPWHFTALFSNTAKAHELGRTHDWVVLYWYDDRHVESQCTVVTETRGPLGGRRVVRGRELECRALYAQSG